MNIIGESTVFYNRKAQHWQAVNGQGHLYTQEPRGKEGAAAILLSVVLHEAPTIGHLAQHMAHKYPQLKTRAINAAICLINSRLHHHKPHHGPGNSIVAEFVPEQGEERHVLTWTNNGPVCSCPDFRFRRSPLGPNGWPFCKHALAYQIQYRPERQKAEMEIKEQDEEIARQLERKRRNMQRYRLNKLAQEHHRTQPIPVH